MIRALATILALGALPAVAAAQVDVGSISGRGGARLERALSRGLEQAGYASGGDDAAVIVGRVRRRRGRFDLQLQITRAGSVTYVRVAHRRPAGLVRRAVEALRANLEARPPATEPAPAPDEPDAPPRAARPRPTATRTAAPRDEGWASPDAALALRVGAGWVYRRAAFADDLHDRIGGYELPAAATLRAELRWFPAAHFTNDALAGLGLRARASFAPGVESGTRDGQASFSSTVDGWRVGLLYALRVGAPVAVEAQLVYGEQRFRLDATLVAGPASAPPPVPSVRYRYLRPGVVVEVDPIDALAIRVGGGWRAVLDTGDLGAWFPRSFTTGFDVSVSAEWRWSRWFAARLHLTYARYVSDFDPRPGDRLVVGGASDDWATVGLDLVVRIPGVR